MMKMIKDGYQMRVEENQNQKLKINNENVLKKRGKMSRMIIIVEN